MLERTLCFSKRRPIEAMGGRTRGREEVSERREAEDGEGEEEEGETEDEGEGEGRENENENSSGEREG